MEIEWKVTTVAGELRAERLARVLARLILAAKSDQSDVVPLKPCGVLRGDGRNEEIPSTQEVSS